MKINNKKEPLRLFFIYRKIVLNKIYTFYDLLYLTCNTLNDANNNYDKLYSIIYASDNEEDIINTIINAQN